MTSWLSSHQNKHLAKPNILTTAQETFNLWRTGYWSRYNCIWKQIKTLYVVFTRYLLASKFRFQDGHDHDHMAQPRLNLDGDPLDLYSRGALSYFPGPRIGQFDRHDMSIDTFWSISDISYDILHVTVLLKPIYAFKVFLLQTLNRTMMWDSDQIHRSLNYKC